MKLLQSFRNQFITSISLLLVLGNFINSSPIPNPEALDGLPDIQLVERGCMQSKPSGITICPTIPTLDQLVKNLNTLGVIKNKDSISYRELGDIPVVEKVAKAWYTSHVKGGRGAVAFGDIMATSWYQNQESALSQSDINPFQKRLSRAYTQLSTGKAYVFLSHGTNGATTPPSTTWGGWEYPALTRNRAIMSITQADPNVSPAEPGTVIWTPSVGPSPNEPLSRREVTI